MYPWTQLKLTPEKKFPEASDSLDAFGHAILTSSGIRLPYRQEEMREIRYKQKSSSISFYILLPTILKLLSPWVIQWKELW